MGVALSLISSLTDRIIPDDLVAIGELGLAGECRAVSNLELRVKEAARLGFRRAIIPFRNVEKRKFECDGMTLIPIRTIFEALSILKAQE
jgi:DNA repair protein RadA/Sms